MDGEIIIETVDHSATYNVTETFTQQHNSTTLTMNVEEDVSYRYGALLLGVFVIATLFGNMLVVLAVKKEKNLRSVTNYLIVSLALADITVGTMVMPLAVYVEVSLPQTSHV